MNKNNRLTADQWKERAALYQSALDHISQVNLEQTPVVCNVIRRQLEHAQARAATLAGKEQFSIYDCAGKRVYKTKKHP